MKRLTIKWKDKLYDTLDPIDIADNDYSKINHEKILVKLGEYEDAEEQGLLLRLPCKVGDTVWCVGNHFVCDYEIRRCLIEDTGIECFQVAKEIEGRDYWNAFTIDDFGRTVFLAREEAEKVLADMGV